MKNWKTFLFGALLAVGAVTKPIAEKRPPTSSEIIEIVAALGLGGSAKDLDVTGTGANARRIPTDKP